MNVDNKKTALNDDSELYKHSTDNMTEKEKFRSLDAKGKWEFFASYYLGKIVLTIVIIGLLGSLLWNIFKPRPNEVIGVIVTDFVMSEEETARVNADFMEVLGLDPEKNEVNFLTNMYFLTDEYNSMQYFAVHLASGDGNVVIMPESVFKNLAPNGYFLTAEEFLSEKELSALSDRFVKSPLINDELTAYVEGSEADYGILISGTEYVSGNGCKEPIVLAVCGNTKDLDKVDQLIKLLFKNLCILE